MPVDCPPASTPDVSKQTASMPQPVTPTFEERSAALQARSAAHDRAVRRKTAIAAPIMAVVATVLNLLFAS